MKNFFSELYWFLKVITTPSCWLQNYKYSVGWDKKLRELLEKEEFTEISEHYAQIGKYKVWVANHPYASFTNKYEARPSRRTILKAMEKLEHNLYSE